LAGKDDFVLRFIIGFVFKEIAESIQQPGDNFENFYLLTLTEISWSV
jgi:hypothetical protein